MTKNNPLVDDINGNVAYKNPRFESHTLTAFWYCLSRSDQIRSHNRIWL